MSRRRRHENMQTENSAETEQTSESANGEDMHTITSETIAQILNSVENQHNEDTTVGFPCFDPDHSRIDVQKCCADVDERVRCDGMQNFDIVPRVENAFLGRAKIWFKQFGFQHYDWTDLRAAIIHTFSSGADVVTQLRKVTYYESKEFSS